MSVPPGNARPHLPLREYTIGWISALPIEHAAAAEILDEEHEAPPHLPNEPTLYTLGRIKHHNVVIACLPMGMIGIASAASVARGLVNRFPNVKVGLMVGIGGGVPSGTVDVRLGDVVVSQPGNGNGGVIQYDMGKRLSDGRFQQTSHLNTPPILLLSALAQIRSNHLRGRSTFKTHLAKLESNHVFSRWQAGPDRLFRSSYRHQGGPNCEACDEHELVSRPLRPADKGVQIHYGTIASSNTLMKDALERDRTCRDLGGGILCLEMEAAGLMNDLPCIVIRGICDYADSHKNKNWQPFASATAAAYAKELVSIIPPQTVDDLIPQIASPGLCQPSANTENPISTPWLVPFNRNPLFTGRSDILENLHCHLEDPERHPYVALYGLGGSGKSAVAVEFAYRARDLDPNCVVFWVSAATTDRFKESYREIAKLLEIPGSDDIENEMLDQVRRKLSGEGQSKWLMIVDNVDDKSILYQPNPSLPGGHRLRYFLPTSRHGMILVTTRRRDVAIDIAKNDVFLLRSLEPEDAQQLFLKALDQSIHTPIDSGAIDTFLQKLTYHALAITQAVAFMNKEQISLSRYVEIIQRADHAIIEALSEEFEDSARDEKSANAVVTTWYISFEQLQRDARLAAEYLSLTSCILPHNIPKVVLPGEQDSGFATERAIGTLKGYDFIQQRGESDFYDVHPLLHLVMQTWLQKRNLWNDYSERVIRRLLTLIPVGGYENREHYVHFLPHAKHVTSLNNTKSLDVAFDLLNRVARCETSLGQYAEAESDHRKVWSWRRLKMGPESPLVLASMHEIAYVTSMQGKDAEAEQLEIQVMELRSRILGREHPSTLTSMNNLASTFWNQGRWRAAEELYIRVIEARKRVLGSEHPETLASQVNLASTYWNQGRWKEAEELNIQVLETQKRVLGPEHPETLNIMNNLALVLGDQGKYSDAESMDRQTLELKRSVLGGTHPDTLTSMSNLATGLGMQRKYAEAGRLLEQCLELREVVLGERHPHTLNSMANLACNHMTQKRLPEAIELMSTCARLSEVALGAEHYVTVKRHQWLKEWKNKAVQGGAAFVTPPVVQNPSPALTEQTVSLPNSGRLGVLVEESTCQTERTASFESFVAGGHNLSKRQLDDELGNGGSKRPRT
ncbi:hypothetical protein BX600DRAFT_438741 [Xylariales sp. PMI_506]|nr:hypothetical protein BX600DRAFT_438741 [Xylariales sp. PMI_506]